MSRGEGECLVHLALSLIKIESESESSGNSFTILLASVQLPRHARSRCRARYPRSEAALNRCAIYQGITNGVAL